MTCHWTMAALGPARSGPSSAMAPSIASDAVAARAFATQSPLALEMGERNGNEKHAALPQALPALTRRPGSLHAGDLMRYRAQTLVVFYVSSRFPIPIPGWNVWTTRLGWPGTLGLRGVRVAFTRDWRGRPACAAAGDLHRVQVGVRRR
ncbi:cyclophilin-like fold protein [Xanthomonas sp. AM6]|uniref:cyclophilin-like fold protein n=1 Tax=Xanthomonas sp. AM6 TaxID=2982531 RepID=UPI0021D89979|nr:cyclophilin-like fold protein [Xanthomonas sp. AM6]UYB54431.1 cyclophilin-like fold protein [Xanthomonas sp. AM6]